MPQLLLQRILPSSAPKPEQCLRLACVLAFGRGCGNFWAGLSLDRPVRGEILMRKLDANLFEGLVLFYARGDKLFERNSRYPACTSQFNGGNVTLHHELVDEAPPNPRRCATSGIVSKSFESVVVSIRTLSFETSSVFACWWNISCLTSCLVVSEIPVPLAHYGVRL